VRLDATGVKLHRHELQAILGRPIRLADVLLAIEPKSNKLWDEISCSNDPARTNPRTLEDRRVALVCRSEPGYVHHETRCQDFRLAGAWPQHYRALRGREKLFRIPAHPAAGAGSPAGIPPSTSPPEPAKGSTTRIIRGMKTTLKLILAHSDPRRRDRRARVAE